MNSVDKAEMQSGEPAPVHVDATNTSLKHHPSGPSSELMDVLGQTVPTGYMFRIPLPFGAENGPVPLFSFRWGLDIFVPNIKKWTRYFTSNNEPADGYNWLSVPEENTQVLPRGYSGAPSRNVEMHFNGPQCLPALISLLYRLQRYDLKYSLRFNGNYAGSGLFMVTTSKGVPRWAGQVSGSKVTFPNMLFSGGPQMGASMANSSVLADTSKSREISFFYPYEFPFEFIDIYEDLTTNLTFTATADNVLNTAQVDNYFIVSARNTIATPDNTTHIDIFVDISVVNPVFRVPMLPFLGMFKAWLPAFTTPSGKSVVAIVNQQTTEAVNASNQSSLRSLTLE